MVEPGPRTLVDKLWDAHVVARQDDMDLLHVDRHLLHDLSGSRALSDIHARGLSVRNPELTFASADHTLSTEPGRTEESNPTSARMAVNLRDRARDHGVTYYGAGDPRQGIVHVIGPELGLTLPGLLLVCGDSHTSTHGALGCLAWGIGSSEVVHVLATQCVAQARPKTMRIRFDGTLAPGVTAKDLILHAIGQLGVGAGVGYAVEYAGPAIDALGIEARMTICNLSIEFGARMGLVAPDDTTFEYLKGRPFAPKGADWDRALADWRQLASEPDANFDAEHVIDAGTAAPQITWGTSPGQTMAIDDAIPDMPDDDMAAKALDYQGLTPGQTLLGTPIDWVFIGSCTNARFSDLEAAAEIAKGRRVADHVTARVVPGSMQVKRQAEAAGLDRIFTEAGFEWREPGCALCVATNGETVGPGERCVSTSNRNFVGRQGPGARTHLASPTTAAASALAGVIADVRKL